MHLTTTILLYTLSTIIATTSAVPAPNNIWGLPDCASSCVTSSFGGCKTIDIECICKNTAFIQNLGCCVSKSCSDDQQAATIQFAQNFCGAYKITDLPTAATCAQTSTPTPSPDSASSPTTDTTTTTTEMPSSPSSLLPALNSAASMAVANTTNGTDGVRLVSVTVTATITATPTGGVGVARGVWGVGMGVGALLAGAVVV